MCFGIRHGSKPANKPMCKGVRQNVDPKIPIGLCRDEQRIRQIILNLMTNVIKVTEKGSVTLTVSRSAQEYGVNPVVSVADTGIGLAEESMEKLYAEVMEAARKYLGEDA